MFQANKLMVWRKKNLNNVKRKKAKITYFVSSSGSQTKAVPS